MSLVVPPNFQHILRVLNTNIEGKTSVMFALTSIKGIGRRYLIKLSLVFCQSGRYQVRQHCAEEGRHPPLQEGW